MSGRRQKEAQNLQKERKKSRISRIKKRVEKFQKGTTVMKGKTMCR